MSFASSSWAVRVAALVVAAAAGITVGDQGRAYAAVGMDISVGYTASEAETFVQTSIDAGYRILNNKQLSADERRLQFRAFLDSITDTKRVALFTLGGYARTASESQIETFTHAYDDFADAMYQGYFDWYTDQKLVVANSVVRSPNDVVVYADIVGPNGARQYKVGFRVRKDDDKRNIVTDFQFEGVWLALNQRSDFTAYLQQHGGDFAALCSELQKRTQRFKEAWAPPGQR